jgi:predicted anti-sigma-YlaC factor YlaD
MNCRKVQNLISAYVDSEIPGVEMLAVRQHLSDCPECNSEFESLLRVKRAYGALSPKDPSPALAMRIHQEIEALSQTPREHVVATLRRRFTFVHTRLGLAAASIAVFAVLLTVRSGQLYQDSYSFLPLPQTAQLTALAKADPQPFFPATTRVEGASPVSRPEPAPTAEPYVGDSASGQPMHITGQANVLFAGYSTTR